MWQQQTLTWQKEQSDLVNDETEALLASLSGETGFCDIIREPLAAIRRRTLDPTYWKPWYLLPLIVCEAISGYYEHAIPASAALQLFIGAGEVFDDIEDADAAESLAARYGPAIAANAATTLLILAETAISRLKVRGVADDIVIRVMDAFNSFYTTACVGQHLDLSLASETTISEDTYLKVAYMKSATTIECACHIGAVLAAAGQETIDSFTRFGRNLGMASQIANDIQGITSGNDVNEHKITLPVVYALTHTEGEAYNHLEVAFRKHGKSVSDFRQTKDLLFGSGAIHYSIIRMETYKQHALDVLFELEKTGFNVEKLMLFLE